MSKVPDSKPSSKWFEKHCFELHRRRVEGMKSSLKSTLKSNGERSVQRNSPTHSPRNLEVQLENAALLRKLAWISTSNSGVSEQLHPSLPTSLNATQRKRDLSRIASENEDLTHRLSKGKASLSMKQLEQDYQRHCEYRRLFKSGYVKRPEHTKRLSV